MNSHRTTKGLFFHHSITKSFFLGPLLDAFDAICRRIWKKGRQGIHLNDPWGQGNDVKFGLHQPPTPSDLPSTTSLNLLRSIAEGSVSKSFPSAPTSSDASGKFTPPTSTCDSTTPATRGYVSKGHASKDCASKDYASGIAPAKITPAKTMPAELRQQRLR